MTRHGARLTRLERLGTPASGDTVTLAAVLRGLRSDWFDPSGSIWEDIEEDHRPMAEELVLLVPRATAQRTIEALEQQGSPEIAELIRRAVAALQSTLGHVQIWELLEEQELQQVWEMLEERRRQSTTEGGQRGQRCD
jgi:hypothetical protein